ALRVMEQAHAPRKTIVVGTLSDYAGSSRRHYRRVAQRALAIAERVWFVGPNAERVRRDVPADGARELLMFPTVRAELGVDQAFEVVGARALEQDQIAGTDPLAQVRCGRKG